MEVFMRRLVEFPLEAGGSVVVEISESDETHSGLVRAARPGEIVVKANEAFEAALDKIKPIVSSVVARMRDVCEAANQVQLEFAIKMSTEAGVVLASAAAEANFKLTVTWKLENEEGKGTA